MEGSTVSDFSIERILSPQLGRRPPVKDFSPGRFLQGVAAGGLCPGPGGLCPVTGGLCPGPGGLCPGPGGLCPGPGGLCPVTGGLCPGPGGLCPGTGGLCPGTGGLCPAPASGCLQFGGMSFGDTFYYGSGFSRFYPNSGVLVHFSSSESAVDAQPLPGYHGHPHSSVPAQPPPRQKARMRTVFTDTQTKHLEALFETSDYPAVEARAGVARSTGLSEETIRVWFKNRRARRKRQRSGSKVKSP